MRNIKPTSSIIKSCQKLLMAKSWTASVRPIVIAYKKKILLEMKPVAVRFCKSDAAGIVITDPDLSYRLSDFNASIYYQRCTEEAERSGLDVENPDFCPLLVALYEERLVERSFLLLMEPITKINPVSYISVDNHRKLVDLAIAYVVTYCGEKNITPIKQPVQL